MDLDPGTIASLRASMSGAVEAPGDAEFEKARRIWTASADRMFLQVAAERRAIAISTSATHLRSRGSTCRDLWSSRCGFRPSVSPGGFHRHKGPAMSRRRGESSSVRVAVRRRPRSTR